MPKTWLGTLAALVGLLVGPAARAETLADLQRRGTLRWGADKTGGGPYLYDQAGKLVGFEVDLADYLAGQLGLRAEFVQSQWEKLPARLNRHDLDIVLNGYEWSAEREQEWSSTIPYYIYRIQLIAGRDDSSIRSWDDLHGRPGRPRKRVGVLRGTAAHRYLERHFGREIEINAYAEAVTSAMQLVKRGRLDASVQDYPASVYYLSGGEFPELRLIGEPVAPGYYVIFVRHDDAELLERLNRALRAAIHDGTLKRVYQKYGIWTAEQAKLAETAERWPPEATPPAATADNLLSYAWLLARAAWVTVLLSCVSMPLAIVMGLMVALGRLYGSGWLARLLTAYVEFLRGTPLLLQLSVIYFVLPELKMTLPASWASVLGLEAITFNLPPFWSGVLGLAINYSAYEAENYRAGLLAVPKGQMEAALALGMSRRTALRRVIVPQAVRIVIPPVTNDFIALFKDTSVCSVIAVSELTGKYSELYNDHPSLAVQLGLMTAVLYLLMSYPLSLVARRLERRAPPVSL